MTYLGFDPGGIKGFGVSIYDPQRSSIIGETVSSVDQAVEWAKRQCVFEPLAAGIDTLLFWQSTQSGWRGADEFLRARYPACRNSVVSSNGLYGSMSVQGAVLAGRLREVWPQLGMTETHPKVLWTALGLSSAYPRGMQDAEAVQLWQSHAAVKDLRLGDEHQLDAALSAWAAERGFSAAWTRDLVSERARYQRAENVSVVDDIHYFWPE